MDEKLYNFIMKLPKENIVNLMFMSLDEMKYYNGQTKKSAVLRALGSEGNKVSLKEAKELTEDSLIFGDWYEKTY